MNSKTGWYHRHNDYYCQSEKLLSGGLFGSSRDPGRLFSSQPLINAHALCLLPFHQYYRTLSWKTNYIMYAYDPFSILYSGPVRLSHLGHSRSPKLTRSVQGPRLSLGHGGPL